MAAATANASPTPIGGIGSAAQAGATGSSGGTTTGTVACSSCCAPQGRFLVSLLSGYGYNGLCPPGSKDNSQPFDFYFTVVLSLDPPYTAAQFCLPSSFTLTAKTIGLNGFELYTSTCSTISPPSTQTIVTTVFNGQSGSFILLISGAYVEISEFYVFICDCGPGSYIALWAGNAFPPNNRRVTAVSCSPPVFSFSVTLFNITEIGKIGYSIGTAAITITF